MGNTTRENETESHLCKEGAAEVFRKEIGLLINEEA